jgi:hypothetical protein
MCPERDRPPRIGGGFRIGRRGPGCGCFSCLPVVALAVLIVAGRGWADGFSPSGV